MSPKLDRWCYLMFFAIGCGLLIAAGYFSWAPAQASALVVENTEVEVLDGYLGQKREVVFVLDNRSRRPLRILGLPGC